MQGGFCCTLMLRLSFCYRLKFLQFGAIIKILFLEKIPERVKIWDIYLKKKKTKKKNQKKTKLWTDEEVESLKKSKHSDELDELIKASFEKTDNDINKIVLMPDGDCPFHDKADRLCKIQKERGAAYL